MIYACNLKVQGKGICGRSQWTAARETAKKSGSKLDEEGIEAAVCRHGILLKSLNMFRGEIFAYPLYLQKVLSDTNNIAFVCTDITCKYYPYMEKAAQAFPDLLPLTDMKPFLSVMHARGHSGKCEVRHHYSKFYSSSLSVKGKPEVIPYNKENMS